MEHALQHPETSTLQHPETRDVIRVTADFAPEAYEVLNDVAKKLQTSKADALRRALGLINFILKQEREGWKLILEKDGKRKEMVPLTYS